MENMKNQCEGEHRRNVKHSGDYLRRNVKFVRGDVRDSELLSKLISESDAIIHLAALVGVERSMYKGRRVYQYEYSRNCCAMG